MTSKIININTNKSEKALGLSYDNELNSNTAIRVLNKPEQHIYNNLNTSLNEIQLHNQGKIELRDARALRDEL